MLHTTWRDTTPWYIKIRDLFRVWHRHAYLSMRKGIIVVVHGDVFTALGNDASLDWYRDKQPGQMQTQVKGGLCPGDKDLKTMRVLNLIVEWTQHLRLTSDTQK